MSWGPCGRWTLWKITALGFHWLDQLGRIIDAIPVAIIMPTVIMGLIVFGMTGLVIFGPPGLTPIMLLLFKITFAVWAVLQGWYLVWGLRVAYRSTGHQTATRVVS